MGDSIFIAEGDRFVGTEQARGPWVPRALHGGAPAALMTAAFERLDAGTELCVARLTFVLHDERGPLGRAFQTLVVEERRG